MDLPIVDSPIQTQSVTELDSQSSSPPPISPRPPRPSTLSHTTFTPTHPFSSSPNHYHHHHPKSSQVQHRKLSLSYTHTHINLHRSSSVRTKDVHSDHARLARRCSPRSRPQLNSSFYRNLDNNLLSNRSPRLGMVGSTTALTMPPRSSLTSSFSVSDANNEVVCPLRNQDGSSCRKRCLGVSFFVVLGTTLTPPPHLPPLLDDSFTNHNTPYRKSGIDQCKSIYAERTLNIISRSFPRPRIASS